MSHCVLPPTLVDVHPTPCAQPGICQLRPGECLTLGLAAQLRMICVLGQLCLRWEDEDRAEVVVCEGESYVSQRLRPLLVTALQPSTLVLAPAPVQTH
jgi:hypothetical protein